MENEIEMWDAIVANEPTHSWTCECGNTVNRYRGQYSVFCSNCDAEYNAGGQRLRSNWRNNPSNYDDDISDMDGYEISMGDW